MQLMPATAARLGVRNVFDVRQNVEGGVRHLRYLVDLYGVDNVMWGSDFPHPDGVWPDSREVIQHERGHLPADVRRKVVCENAGRFYGFIR